MSHVTAFSVSSRHRFWCLMVLALGTFILGVTEFATMPMLPLIAESFGASPAQSGQIISAYAIGVVVGAPLLMLLTGKMDRRYSLMLFAFLMFVGNGLSAMASSIDELTAYRFLSGLPHGAYFGTAFLLAADMAPSNKRANYMARVFFGLTIATIVGVPLMTLAAQLLNWQACMLFVAVLALITVVLLRAILPASPVLSASSLVNEMGVLKKPLVWSIMGIVIIGFGGVFCIYTYLADTILEVTEAPATTISVAMVMFGIGSTTGNWICGRLGDHIPVKTAGAGLLICITMGLIYVEAAHNIWALYAVVFCLGTSVGLSSIIQTLLMDAAPEGHAMVGALVQCGFNTANAIGPWAGSVILAAGAAPNMTGFVAAGLFTGGFVMWMVSAKQIRRRDTLETC